MSYLVLGRGSEELGRVESLTPEALLVLYERVAAQYPGCTLAPEFFDVLDFEGNRTGKIKPRTFVHGEGDWHGALHVQIARPNGNGGSLVWQIRKDDADIAPGKVDVAAGGHYGAGESVEEGFREVEEELGFPLTRKEVLQLGRAIHYDNGINGVPYHREFRDVHMLCDPRDIENYPFTDEVKGLVEAPLELLIPVLFAQSGRVPVKRVLRNADGRKKTHSASIMFSDIWTSRGYALRTAYIAQRLLADQPIPNNPYSLPVEELI